MFDYILACHCCYYCDEGETIYNNLAEYKRILKLGGVLITSVADLNSYIFKDAEKMLDGTMRIKNDPYNGVLIEDGHLLLSDKPGLGLSLKKKYLGLL